ncbi:MAG: InlB B-repeat-containing protein [Bacteroidota bacterium]
MKRLALLFLLTLFSLFSCVHESDTTSIISVSVDPPGSGVVTGAGTYTIGAEVVLSASPSSRMVFQGWESNGTIVSTENPFRFIATDDLMLVAHFADYRQSLYGNYSGTRNNVFWMMNNPSSYDTTFAYAFTVSPHPSPDSIIVDNMVFPIDTTLYFYEMPYPGQIRSLEFVSDSCKVYFRSGGLGGFSSSNILGARN